MDYSALGLKVGLEFHQRLDTHKLFCDCPSSLSTKTKPDFIITRKLRPVSGEMGEIDTAALLESMKNKTFEYWGYNESTCLVELDESPPVPLNQEALDIALEISLLLNCDIVDELHVMRKTVIDGSNTSGFQRTAMIGNAGVLKTQHGDVGILGVFLEEEAAGIVEEKNNVKTYRLDRLGIPLVEIATGIMTFTPAQVKEVALELGTLLRVTGKVQRGLGTIRQDVNISITHGNRVEVKGLQDISILDKVIEYEVMRQKNLLEIKEELEERGIKKNNPEVQSFSAYFKDTKCGMLKSALSKGEKIHGIALKNYKGLLGKELSPGRRFGTELAGIAKNFGFKGLIHTDEDLSKYAITEDVAKIYKDLKLKENDSLIIIAGEPSKMKPAFETIIQRINQALESVPHETRKPLPDGSTEYMRSLAGAHRMYPETDIPPILISEKRLTELKKQLPEKPEEIEKQLREKYKLSEELADKLITSPRRKLFYELCETGVSPTIIASTLEETLVDLRRNNVDISKINDKHFREVFKALSEKKIAKEAVPQLLTEFASKPSASISELIKEEKHTEKDLEKEADKIIAANPDLKDNKHRLFNVVMGGMMKKYRGKVDGEVISKAVREKVK